MSDPYPLTDEELNKLDAQAKRIFKDRFECTSTPHKIFDLLLDAFTLGKQSGRQAAEKLEARNAAEIARVFVKRPATFEAVQFDGTNEWKIALWSRRKALGSPILEPGPGNPGGHYIQVQSTGGVMIANPGDWIVRGPDDDIYVCDAQVFEKTYAPR